MCKYKTEITLPSRYIDKGPILLKWILMPLKKFNLNLKNAGTWELDIDLETYPSKQDCVDIGYGKLWFGKLFKKFLNVMF